MSYFYLGKGTSEPSVYENLKLTTASLLTSAQCSEEKARNVYAQISSSRKLWCDETFRQREIWRGPECPMTNNEVEAFLTVTCFVLMWLVDVASDHLQLIKRKKMVSLSSESLILYGSAMTSVALEISYASSDELRWFINKSSLEREVHFICWSFQDYNPSPYNFASFLVHQADIVMITRGENENHAAML